MHDNHGIYNVDSVAIKYEHVSHALLICAALLQVLRARTSLFFDVQSSKL